LQRLCHDTHSAEANLTKGLQTKAQSLQKQFWSAFHPIATRLRGRDLSWLPAKCRGGQGVQSPLK
jgi:hypothetical protein